MSAREIHEKQFHDAWRGYNQEEVDDFLDRVAATLDRVQRENQALQQRVKDLDQTVAASRDTEEMLKKTLVTAQRAAEEAIATAKAKAEQLIGEAEERARTAQAEAERQAAEVEQQHTARRRDLDAEIERLRAFEGELKQRLKAFLDEQLRSLERLGRPEVRGPQQGPSGRPVAQASQAADRVT